MARWIILLLAIALLGGIPLFIASKMKVSNSGGMKNGDPVIVVAGSSVGLDKGMHLQVASPKNSTGNLVEAIARTGENGDPPSDSIARRLHNAVVAEREDANWSKSVNQKIGKTLLTVPYLTGERNVACGATRCELSVKLERGISSENTEFARSRFYSASGVDDESESIVEGVFLAVDADGSSRLIVIYIRR